MGVEVSKASWKIGVLLPGSPKLSRFTVKGGDVTTLSGRLASLRAKAERCGKPVRILSCYEAGLDGHWLHRWLTDQGGTGDCVYPSSIEGRGRGRRAKTDRIDLEKWMRAFLAYLRGEPRVCSMLHVPSPEDEDRKRSSRERDRLLKEQTAHTNRIKALLFGQGIRDVMPLKPGFIASLQAMRTGDGRALPARLKEELVREHERLCLAHKQVAALEAQGKAELRVAAPGSVAAKIMQLIDLKSIGVVRRQKLDNAGSYPRVDNRGQERRDFSLAAPP